TRAPADYSGGAARSLERVLLTGANGLIGGALQRTLRPRLEIRRLVRSQPRPNEQSAFYWDPASGVIDARAFEDVDAVVHLAGEPVLGRWTRGKRRRVLESRVLGTRLVIDAADRAGVRVVVSASAVGYYGCDPGDAAANEQAPCGDGFLAQVCREWERAATDAITDHDRVRLVLARIGVVLSPNGGALGLMRRHAQRARLVMIAGRGDQPVPWISMPDTLRAIERCLEDPSLRGPINLVAPNPVTQRELAKSVATRCGARTIHAPAPVLRLIAGDLAREVLLGGRRVTPTSLLDNGFRFQHETLASALDEAVAETPDTELDTELDTGP
ncbi:MAG: TIGR01777 family oxidoreductase, partial [Planctomycetota bacterium]